MGQPTREDRYAEAAAAFGAAIERLARGYERDPDKSRDLVQEIHIALWLSLSRFESRCSLRTWVYRVAHNVATSKAIRRQANKPLMLSFGDDLESVNLVSASSDAEIDRGLAMDRLYELIQRLRPLDRQVILLYLEEETAASIAEITGLTAANVATKVSRIKQLLKHWFHQGVHDER
jgi:RNA polymerase sigma-70 factor (ECF subfamily)